MRRMHAVYVAGAYSSDTTLGTFANMRRGITAAYRLLTAGYAPFCPHLDYHYALRGEVSIEQMYAYSMAWLEKADAVLVVQEGFMDSRGAKAEVARAQDLGIPVFHSFDDLDAWAARHPGHEVDCPAADEAHWDDDAAVVGATP